MDSDIMIIFKDYKHNFIDFREKFEDRLIFSSLALDFWRLLDIEFPFYGGWFFWRIVINFDISLFCTLVDKTTHLFSFL